MTAPGADQPAGIACLARSGPPCARLRKAPRHPNMGAGCFADQSPPAGRTSQAASHMCPGQPIGAQPAWVQRSPTRTVGSDLYANRPQ